MKFKRLDLIGFKSFVEKTSIAIESGLNTHFSSPVSKSYADIPILSLPT